jgi:hypothetical protein
MDVWNSQVELRFQVKTLESKLFKLERRMAVLENDKATTTTIYGKEVKSK